MPRDRIFDCQYNRSSSRSVATRKYHRQNRHYLTFVTSCKTSLIKIWFVLAAGLAENFTQVAFRQPFVIQHVRNRISYFLYFFITIYSLIN